MSRLPSPRASINSNLNEVISSNFITYTRLLWRAHSPFHQQLVRLIIVHHEALRCVRAHQRAHETHGFAIKGQVTLRLRVTV